MDTCRKSWQWPEAGFLDEIEGLFAYSKRIKPVLDVYYMYYTSHGQILHVHWSTERVEWRRPASFLTKNAASPAACWLYVLDYRGGVAGSNCLTNKAEERTTCSQ